VANHRVIIQPGEYECFIAQPEYGRKQAADAISYVWDRLIENFIEHALAGTSAEILDTPPKFRLSESALRIMAAETRFRRRKLGQGISEAMKVAEAQKMALFVRNIVPTEDSAYRDIGYVFLILAFPGNNALPGGYAEYREVRTSLLQVYCLNLFDMHPELETVVGIGIDASERVTGHPGGSEDLIAFPRPEWTDKLRAQFEDARQAYGLKPRCELRTQVIREDEFPVEGAPFATRQQRRAAERRAAKNARLAWALIRPRR